MQIAVVGCGHGEIDKIYEVIESIEAQRGIKVSLLLCCGDFQSVRNMTDLRCMACPIKYQQMHDFHRYYSGEKKAPILTLFIGGNHEASNFLQELPYGGWVAPNIFYMGYVGVFKFGGIRIAGISGIYKGQDYLKGRYEAPPYDQSTMRSVYHYRNLDIFRLKQLKLPVDIVLSHDWPKGIHQFGNTHQLLRRKPFFRDEIERNELGSRPLFEVLEKIQPKFWFSAHMHVKFPAYVEHPQQSSKEESTQEEESSSIDADSTAVVESKITKFLALDKVLPRRQFLQIIEIPTFESDSDPPKLEYDVEWLAVLKSTNHLISLSHKNGFMPGPGGNTRFDFTPTEVEIDEVTGIFAEDQDTNFLVPDNFSATSSIYSPGDTPKTAFPIINPQTREFCQKLGVTDPLEDILENSGNNALGGNNQVLDTPNERSGRFTDYSSLIPSQLDLTMNQTSQFEESLTNPNPDEISLDDDNDNEDVPIPMAEVEKDPICSRSKLVLPPPKTSTTKTSTEGLFGNDEDGNETAMGASAAELELLQSVMGKPEEVEESAAGANLFFIDTAGEEEPHTKRRKDLASFKY